MTNEFIDITPSPQILSLITELDVADHLCLAELIDNSLDNFQMTKNKKGEVKINFENGKLIIRDNGDGLEAEEISNLLRAGSSSKDKTKELGLYGVGFNVAVAKLGTHTTVYSKTKNSEWCRVKYNVSELQKNESFKVPLEKNINCNYNQENGTVIEIKLDKKRNQQFSSNVYISKIANKLGDIYSYLIREGVPGLTDLESASEIKANIFLNDKKIKPLLPCIWSEERTVTRRKEEISAVEKFNFNLGEGKKCQNCRHWNNENVSHCERCGSDKLTLETNKLWGWIGVQRFLDTDHYGFDLLRNGRKILIRDKEFFQIDGEDGILRKEYPVEMPADKGRLVGEIHVDFLSPDYIKKDFKRDDGYWKRVKFYIRGDNPLKPRGREGENNSPLERMFSAFRRNEKGLVDLNIGSSPNKFGNQKLAREWYDRFLKGEEDYLTDEKWYDSAKDAQEKKTGIPGGNPTLVGDGSGPPGGGEGIPTPVPGGGGTTTSISPIKTRSEIIESLIENSTELEELSGDLPISNDSVKLTFRECKTEITLDDKKNYSIYIETIGNKKIVFFDPHHKNFKDDEIEKEYKFATCLALDLGNKYTMHPDELTQVVNKFIFNKKDFTVDKDEVEEFKENLFTKFIENIDDSKKSRSYFDQLSENDKKNIKERIAIENIKEIEEKIDNGSFIRFCKLRNLATIISKNKKDFFNNKLFKQTYLEESHNKLTEKNINYVINALNQLSEIIEQKLDYQHDEYEKKLFKLNIYFIRKSLVSDHE